MRIRSLLLALLFAGAPAFAQVVTNPSATGIATGTVSSVACTPTQGVTCTVSSATSTPGIAVGLGDITPTTVNKVTVTAPATGSTLTIADGKTLTVSNTLTLAGTDGKTFTLPNQNASAVGYVGSVPYATLVANNPCNGTWSGYKAFATDWGAYGAEVRCNGTRWVPTNGRVLLKHLGASVSGVTNTATIVLQTPAMPPGTVQATDSILFEMPGYTKSGTTDIGLWAMYVGTACTTADTAIVGTNNQVLSAANQSAAVMVGLKIATNTSVQRVGSASGGWMAVSTVAPAAPVTVTDISASSVCYSASIFSGGTTNTVGMQDGFIWQVAN